MITVCWAWHPEIDWLFFSPGDFGPMPTNSKKCAPSNMTQGPVWLIDGPEKTLEKRNPCRHCTFLALQITASMKRWVVKIRGKKQKKHEEATMKVRISMGDISKLSPEDGSKRWGGSTPALTGNCSPCGFPLPSCRNHKYFFLLIIYSMLCWEP